MPQAITENPVPLTDVAGDAASETPASSPTATAGVGGSRLMPKGIVHIVKHCGYGNGNVHVAVDLACIQARAGHDVTFVSAGGTFEPLLVSEGVRHLTMSHEQKDPLAVLSTAWKLARFCWKHRPGVLHAHMMSSALVGFATSRLTGIPLVTTVHNSFDPHSSLMRLGDRVVAVSDAEREQLLQKGYPKDKVVSVLNAPSHSPREPFMRDEIEVTVQRPCIVAANALHRRKGVFDLIAVCAELFAEFPDWRLYLAGEGPDREQLEAQAQEAGIADRVTFLGFLRAPRPLMLQADIFVLASYADPCSLGVGEARSAGCAIVASSVGGTPQMLEFGRAGRLFAPGNRAELKQELSALMSSKAEREALQRASLEGSEIFNVNRLLDDYNAVYREAIVARGGKVA